MPTNSFVKVRDTNRKPIRGLWQRGGRYYLQIRERGSASPRRIALKATNLSEAKLAAEEKRREAREGDLPVRGRKPTLAELADTCLAIAATKKKPRTVKEDAHRLRRGKTTLGHVRVDLITTAMIAVSRDTSLNLNTLRDPSCSIQESIRWKTPLYDQMAGRIFSYTRTRSGALSPSFADWAAA